MEFLRRDETSDPLAPYVLYLWTMRWWILAPALIVLVSTYLILRLVREEFVVTSEIYINRLVTDPAGDEVPPSPASAAKLLKSDALLFRVREEFQREFPETRPVYEKFSKWFKVKTDILQDTTVRKDISPVVGLEVRAQGTSETRFLMDSWIRNFIATYGSYSTQESVLKSEALEQENALLEKAIQAAEKQSSRIQNELIFQEKLLAETMDILAPAQPDRRPQREALTDSNIKRQGGDTNLDLMINMSALKRPGLLARLTDVRLNLAAANNNTSGSTPTLQLQQEALALAMVAGETQTSITALQAAVGDLQQQLNTYQREIQAKRLTQRTLQESLNRFAVAAAVQKNINHDGYQASADVRALSSPITPEKRIWPQRTLAAGIGALCTAILAIVMLLFHRYMQKISSFPNNSGTA